MSTKKDDTKSRRFPLVDGCADRHVAWPENIDGFVVTQQELEDFIGNQTLRQAQATAKRFDVVAEAARRIAHGEEVEMNWKLIHFVASEDESADYQRVMRLMLRAIKQGEQGINAAGSTAMHVMDYGFEYMTSYGSELIYEEGLERMKRATKMLD